MSVMVGEEMIERVEKLGRGCKAVRIGTRERVGSTFFFIWRIGETRRLPFLH